jgi:hypothetical protein
MYVHVQNGCIGPPRLSMLSIEMEDASKEDLRIVVFTQGRLQGIDRPSRAG